MIKPASASFNRGPGALRSDRDLLLRMDPGLVQHRVIVREEGQVEWLPDVPRVEYGARLDARKDEHGVGFDERAVLQARSLLALRFEDHDVHREIVPEDALNVYRSRA
jgi:hypothetical protein